MRPVEHIIDANLSVAVPLANPATLSADNNAATALRPDEPTSLRVITKE